MLALWWLKMRLAQEIRVVSRDFDPEDTLRFYALRMKEVGFIKLSPQQIITRAQIGNFSVTQARAEDMSVVTRVLYEAIV